MLLTFEFSAMASQCEVRVHAPDFSTGQSWADAAMIEVARIEKKYSRFRDDSVTTAINRSAGCAPIVVDAETRSLLDFADTLHGQSGGLFDLTSGVLRRAWNFKDKRVPAQEALDALLPLVGWSRVERNGEKLGLPLDGMELDFGGIGKEYAADRAATVMAELGATHGLVNLGGDVRILGPEPDGRPWRVGIQDPRADPGRTIAHLDVSLGGVATSGDYERFFEIDGVRYCHVLDPRTGWPVAHWQSVSVIAPLTVAAGACATIAMLMSVGDAVRFLDSQGLRYLAIDASGERHAR